MGGGLIVMILGSLIGGAGAVRIMRLLRGWAATGGIFLWLLLPMIVFALLVVMEIDADWSAQRKSRYIASVDWIPVVILVCWFPGVFFGTWMGFGLRRPLEMPIPFPHWPKSESASLSLEQLSALMRDMAARAGIPEPTLPSSGPINGDDGAYIDIHHAGYRYVGLERGAVSFEHRTVVADELMYRVFRDRSWMVAAGYVVGHPTAPEQNPETIAERQREILATIDPRWGQKFALDHAVGSRFDETCWKT